MACRLNNIFNLLVTLLLLFTISSCKQAKVEYYSEVEKKSFFSRLLEDSIYYNVYRPHTKHPIDGYDLLYLLHGHGGNHDDWFEYEEGRVQPILDSLIKNQMIPPVVAVSLDAANSWYVNRHIPMESVYFDEFIPHIDSSLQDFLNKEKRVIAGNSAGGYGALRFILKYPDHFSSGILLSPAAYEPVPPGISSSRKIDVFAKDSIFNDSIWNSFSYTNIPINAPEEIAHLLISTGIDDEYEIITVIDSLKLHLDKNNIDYNVTLVPGGHEWNVWREIFALDVTRAFEIRK
ncbi:MAG: esterase family protein [Saprospiraceae bacterium]|nr:esterase family protein [Saprospiraceae bacterium]